MPRGDKTGPMGIGARTGRGLGTCDGSSTLAKCAGLGLGLGGLGLGLACRNAGGRRKVRGGSMQGPGRGMGRTMGRGVGRRMNFNQEEAQSSKEILTSQKELLEERLNLIQKELENLED